MEYERMTDEKLKKELVRDGLFTGINNHLRTIASKSSVISIPVSPATAKGMLTISNETFLAWKLENTIAFKAGRLWACVFPIELEFGSVGFLRREENWRTLRKTLGARTRTNNKLDQHMTPAP